MDVRERKEEWREGKRGEGEDEGGGRCGRGKMREGEDAGGGR